MHEVVKMLRLLKERYGLNYNEIAALVGCHPSSIIRIYRGDVASPNVLLVDTIIKKGEKYADTHALRRTRDSDRRRHKNKRSGPKR